VLHLIHPALVHFSVAFLVTGGVCEAVGIFKARVGLERFGAILVLAGVASLLPTIVTGFLAKNSITIAAEAAGAVAWHERLELIAAAVFVGSQFWKAWGGGRLPDRQRAPYACVLTVGVLLVIAGAAVGGHMVYRLGVGIE
jgi:uncharacterized membrane protein